MTVNQEPEIYTVVGMSYGSFEDKQTGNGVFYAQLFVTAPFKAAKAGSDYHTKGDKCFVMKCVSPDVFANVEVGDEVQLFFNQYGKVSHIATAA